MMSRKSYSQKFKESAVRLMVLDGMSAPVALQKLGVTGTATKIESSSTKSPSRQTGITSSSSPIITLKSTPQAAPYNRTFQL